MIRTALRGNELERALPDPPEFYWSKIQRAIEAGERSAPRQASSLGWDWLRPLLAAVERRGGCRPVAHAGPGPVRRVAGGALGGHREPAGWHGQFHLSLGTESPDPGSGYSAAASAEGSGAESMN